MRRRTFTLAAVTLSIVTAAALGASPSASFAAQLWRWMLLGAGFALLAVGLPAYLALKAHGTRVPWRATGRLVVRESPIEAAVVMMLAATMLIGGTGPGGVAGLAALGFAVAVVATVVAASVEHLWGYMVPEDADSAT